VSECGSDEFTVEVRGEVYLSSEDFLKLQSLSQSTDTSGVDSLPYSLTSSSDVSGTPRNRAAGILRLKDDTSLTTALLQFSAYSVVVWPTATSDDVSFNTATSQYTAHTLRSQTHTLTLLKECGFHVAECSQTFDIKCASEGVMGVDELLRHLLTMESKRSDLPYDTDGLVLKVLYYTILYYSSSCICCVTDKYAVIYVCMCVCVCVVGG
jgi:NAD-dependent DNA ligase